MLIIVQIGDRFTLFGNGFQQSQVAVLKCVVQSIKKAAAILFLESEGVIFSRF